MSFITDPELMLIQRYAPEDEGGEGGGGGGSGGEGGAGNGADGAGNGADAALTAKTEGEDGADKGADKTDPPGEGEEGEDEDKLAPELEELAQRRALRLLDDHKAELAKLAEAEGEDAEVDAKILEADGRIEESLHNTAATLKANLKDVRFLDADGKAVPLTDKQIDEWIHGPLNKHLDALETEIIAEAIDEYAAAPLELIPPEGVEAYLKATVDKKLTPLEHVKAMAEAIAPTTKAWKAREGAFQDEKAEAVAVATNKGLEAGKAHPAVAGSQQGTKGQGDIKEQYEQGTPATRQQLWRDHPEEMRRLAGVGTK